MKLLIFVNKFDENDDLLGFFVGWASNLAKNFEKIIIITQFIGIYPQTNNVDVFSLNKEKNESRLGRLFHFYGFLWRLKHDYDAAFIFMAPVWVIAAWPILKIIGKKMFLWYAVWKSSLKLYLATFLSDKVISSVSQAFPFKSKKLILVGQGIDIDYFKPNEPVRNPDKILLLGRISPIKKIEVFLHALKMLKMNSSETYNTIGVDIVGGPSSRRDEEYMERLRDLEKTLGVEGKINWVGGVSHGDILPYYQKAGIFVNLTQTGSFDKTMLEAMACGDFLLTSNRALTEFFDHELQRIFLYGQDNPADLCSKLLHLFSENFGNSAELRLKLRNIIVQNHSQVNLVNNLTRIFKSI